MACLCGESNTKIMYTPTDFKKMTYDWVFFDPQDVYEKIKYIYEHPIIDFDTDIKNEYGDFWTSFGSDFVIADCNIITILAEYKKFNKTTEYLISKNIRAKNEHNITVLMMSVYWANLDLIEYLINQNINLDEQDIEGLTALSWAVIYTRYDEKKTDIILKLLINNGANINLPDKFGNTALMFTSLETSLTTKHYIQGYDRYTGYKYCQDSFWPYKGIYHCKKCEAAHILIKAGAYLTQKNNDGKTACDMTNCPEIRKTMTNILLLRERQKNVFEIRCFSKNKMKDAFEIYNVAYNTYLFLPVPTLK